MAQIWRPNIVCIHVPCGHLISKRGHVSELKPLVSRRGKYQIPKVSAGICHTFIHFIFGPMLQQSLAWRSWPMAIFVGTSCIVPVQSKVCQEQKTRSMMLSYTGTFLAGACNHALIAFEDIRIRWISLHSYGAKSNRCGQ